MIEKAYQAVRSALASIRVWATPALRRALRFLALPYCYVAYVDWEECARSRLQVAGDLLYIFFVLKYFPENYGYCRLWAKDRSEWRYYYGSNYDAYQRHRLQREIQRPEYQVLFTDKEVCQQLCDGSGLNMPPMLGTLEPKEDFRADLRRMMKSGPDRRAIIKPARGSAGQGIVLAEFEDGEVSIKRSGQRVALEEFVLSTRSVVQRFVAPDPEMALLSPATSIRLITMLTRDDRVIFLAGEVNTAATDSFLSNWSDGGVAVGLDPASGRIHRIGFDKHGREYTENPMTGTRFEEYVVPKWDEIRDLAVRTQRAFPYFRLLGPDIALAADGPILYEINAIPDLASMEQHGPLLRKPEVLAEFGAYDLLVNKHQRELWRAALKSGSGTATTR